MKGSIDIGKAFLKLVLGRGVFQSYAQDGEDMLARSLLPQKKGTYVDIGAYHPFLYSNTFHFYRKGWSGVVIDPNPDLKRLYRVFRPRDTFVNCAVGSTESKAQYHRFSDGAYNTLDNGTAQRIKESTYPTYLGSTTVDVLPLHVILKDIKQIDFLSIDTEGMDMEIIQTLNWANPPRVIAVEDNTLDTRNLSTNAIALFLAQKGYTIACLAPRTLIFALP